MPNRLINETSPYLLQHANNPVDWYPWGNEAFEKAKAEDKPILLSIGYSACHWCHVMERESFEEASIARQMNRQFVSIKVDREERPDIDSIYMHALQAMTGQGGWPTTMFLTPDGKPFFGGTYYPPDDQHGIIGFPRVLQAVAQAYRNQREDIDKSADEVIRRLTQMTTIPPSQSPLTDQILDNAAINISEAFDRDFGGFGTAPKFPQPLIGEFLLRTYHRTRESSLLRIVEFTLQQMARGGIYDHLAGGFHRYSTDAIWLVPHFEKMLCDNALLSRLYLNVYQATGNSEYREVAEEILDYVIREMTAPSGGFYSAQDADSEGEEGKFYVWSASEIIRILGNKTGEMFTKLYGITVDGNFEGMNVLFLDRSIKSVADEHSLKEDELKDIIVAAKARLLEERNQRIPPMKDDKILTSWNGLMMISFAEAANVLGRNDYLEVAKANAIFLLENLRAENRLLRSFRDRPGNVKGYLEDYSFLINGLLALYEASFEKRWLEEAQGLSEQMIALFWNEPDGTLYDTGTDHETLVIRPRDVFDNAAPSGGSMAVKALLHLATLTGQPEYERIAIQSLHSLQLFLEQVPNGLPYWLCALDYHLSTPKEVIIIGDRNDSRTMNLREAVFGQYLPNKVVAGFSSEVGTRADIFLLENREAIGGAPTVYVCENNVCLLPVTDGESLALLLKKPQSS
jgi:uncharacterized protein YyaL (SSP411 family)